jgi:NAD(P)-dependent dehydrogenase (short-subunit alcohol dehydrogenase family)
MRRRSLMRWARFRIALRSGFALVALAEGGSGMVTAGPPSVAIFVAAILPSSDGASTAGSGAVDGATAAGGGVSGIAATFTSSTAAGVSACATGATGRLGTTLIEMIDGQLDVIAITHRTELQTASRSTSLFDIETGCYERPSVRSVRCDLSSEQEILRTIQTVTSLSENIDYVINAAGDLRFLGSTTDAMMIANDVRQQFELNVLAPTLICSTLFHYHWKQKPVEERRASILLVSSLSGAQAFLDSEQGFYAASKAAISMLAKHMAVEYGRYGISVNALLPNSFPGAVGTRIVASHALKIISERQSGNLFKIG